MKRTETNQKCPQCNKSNMTVVKKFRINYNHGRNSKPIKTIKKRERFCNCGFYEVKTNPPEFLR